MIPNYASFANDMMFISKGKHFIDDIDSKKILIPSRFKQNKQNTLNEIVLYLNRAIQLGNIRSQIAKNEILAFNPLNNSGRLRSKEEMFDQILEGTNYEAIEMLLEQESSRKILFKRILKYLEEECKYPTENEGKYLRIAVGYIPLEEYIDLHSKCKGEHGELFEIINQEFEKTRLGPFGKKMKLSFRVNEQDKVIRISNPELEYLLNNNFEGMIGESFEIQGKLHTKKETLELISLMYKVFSKPNYVRRIPDLTTARIHSEIEECLISVINLVGGRVEYQDQDMLEN